MSILNVQFGQTGVQTNLSRLTEKMQAYGVQLSTGKVGQKHSDYAMGSHILMGIRQQNNQANSYLYAIDTARPTMDVMYKNLERLEKLSLSLRQDAVSLISGESSESRAALEARAQNHLEESISIYNSNISGRYLFSGRLSQQKPVESSNTILNGDAQGRDGLKQIIEERMKADTGNDNLGRLTLTQTSTTALSIAKDSDHDFGLQMTSLRLPDGTLASLTSPLNEGSVDFSTLNINAGDEIALSFELPNNQTHSISLVAQNSHHNEPYGFSIGPTASATMLSFKDTLETALTDVSSTQLSAASLYVSGQNFFDVSRPVQRITGNDPFIATTFEDATHNNTVSWYKGEVASTSNPEDRRQITVDDGHSIGYAVSADELSLRNNLMMGALFIVEKDITDTSNNLQRQMTLSQYISENIKPNHIDEGITSVLSSFASKLETTIALREMHSDMSTFTEGLISEMETVDINEVSVRILDTRTRLETSYKLTAMLSEMSIVNYL